MKEEKTKKKKEKPIPLVVGIPEPTVEDRLKILEAQVIKIHDNQVQIIKALTLIADELCKHQKMLTLEAVIASLR